MFSFLKTSIPNSSITTTSDLWQSPSPNSNTINQSFYFQSSFDFNHSTNPSQYHTIENNSYDYQLLPDVSSSYLIDPYSQLLTNSYSIDPYSSAQTTYNSTSMDYSSSTYASTTDSYQHVHPMYNNTNVTATPVSSYFPSSSSPFDIQSNYQSTSSQWDSTGMKMYSHDGMYTNSLYFFYIIQKWIPICHFSLLPFTKKKKTDERKNMSVF